MKVTFLGTGTSGGVPMIGCSCRVCRSPDPKDKRLRSAVLIEDDSTRLVIDCGPDFRQQMLRQDVDRLDAIVFTHEHKDHTGGLDDVRAYNHLLRKPMALYGRPAVFDALKQHYDYAFHSNYPGVPSLELHEVGTEEFTVGTLELTPIELMHFQLPVLGFRCKDFTYITDASFIPKAEKEKIKGSEVLVINALRREKHISHFTLQQALELVGELNPGRAYLTHISHQMGLYAELNPTLPKGAEFAYDGLTLYL